MMVSLRLVASIRNIERSHPVPMGDESIRNSRLS